MSDYTKARGVHSIVTPSERADALNSKNRGRLISKLARLNHQKLLLERLNRVWVEQQQGTLSRLRRLQAQIDAIHDVTGIAMPSASAPHHGQSGDPGVPAQPKPDGASPSSVRPRSKRR